MRCEHTDDTSNFFDLHRIKFSLVLPKPRKDARTIPCSVTLELQLLLESLSDVSVPENRSSKKRHVRSHCGSKNRKPIFILCNLCDDNMELHTTVSYSFFIQSRGPLLHTDGDYAHIFRPWDLLSSKPACVEQIKLQRSPYSLDIIISPAGKK